MARRLNRQTLGMLRLLAWRGARLRRRLRYGASLRLALRLAFAAFLAALE